MLPNDSRPGRAESMPACIAWGSTSLDTEGGVFDSALLWMTGGGALLVWTAFALLLTS